MLAQLFPTREEIKNSFSLLNKNDPHTYSISELDSLKYHKFSLFVSLKISDAQYE